MRIDVVTLFPKMFVGPFEESIVKRAQDKGLVKINIHNLRNWAIDKRGTVDDRPYGGGAGMVLRPEPFFEAVVQIKKDYQKGQKTEIILLSASGKKYTQKTADKLSQKDNIILLCGHYEGVDERVGQFLTDEEISIGDYVLTGGEIPTMVIIDSIVRLLPGVLKKPEATQLESFSKNTPLEHPQYTRPEIYQKHHVPQILLSGNHQEIKKWQEEKGLEKTRRHRPDLL